jgi:hypothetical protein
MTPGLNNVAYAVIGTKKLSVRASIRCPALDVLHLRILFNFGDQPNEGASW